MHSSKIGFGMKADNGAMKSVLDQWTLAEPSRIGAAPLEYSVALLRTLDEIEPVWRVLEQCGDATVFQAFDTFAAWTRHIARAYEGEWFVVAVRNLETRRPAMLLPLVLQVRGKLAVIEAADLGVCDFNGPVLERGFLPTREEMTRIWRDVRALLPTADVICLTKMPAVIGTHPNPLLLLGASHRIALSNYKTPLGRDWTRAALPEKVRADLDVRRRKLEKIGTVSFRSARTEAEADSFYAAMIEQRGARSAATGRSNILDCISHRQFYRALLTPEAETSVACIQALLVDDEIVATGFGLVSDEAFHMIFPTFKAERWRNYSPGMQLFVESMCWAAARGIAYYDFTIGGEEFKMTLGAVEFPLYAHLEPLTLRGVPTVYRERLWRAMGSNARLRAVVHKARAILQRRTLGKPAP